MKAIVATNVSKKYEVFSRPWDLVKEILFLGKRKFHHEFWALRNICLEVESGKTIGIIGSNGAGKSTLLKLLTGTTHPSAGELFVNGRITGLLELGAGFHPEFSGRDNIYMNCSLLGMSRDETDERFQSIHEFSELGNFIDQPVKTYSSGMHMRLGFSVATSVDPDILVIDEALAVGDQYFQRKCVERLKDFKEKGKTIIFVSHDLGIVNTLCDFTVWLREGVTEAYGETESVVEKYVEFSREKEGKYVTRLETLKAQARKDFDSAEKEREDLHLRHGSGEIKITKVRLLDERGKEKNVFHTGEKMTVEAFYETTAAIDSPTFGVAIFRNDGVYCYGPNTRLDNVYRQIVEGKGKFSITYESLNLLQGSYSLSVAIYDREEVFPYDFHNRMYLFEVKTDLKDHGVVYLPHVWNLERI